MGEQFIRAEADYLLILRDRLIDRATLREQVGEAKTGLHVIGLQPYRLRMPDDRIVAAADGFERESEVVLRLRNTRIRLQGPLIFADRLIVPVPTCQGDAEVAVRAAVPRIDANGVLPQLDAVAPVQRLRPRGDRQRDDDARGCRRHQPPGRRATLHAQCGSPGDDDENARERQVREAVGHRMAAHLHQTADRHQRSEIPEPSSERERRATDGEDCGCGQSEEHPGTGGDEDDREVRAVRIERNQTKRPDRLHQVGGVRHDRVRHPCWQRLSVRERDGADGLLRLQRHPHGCYSERDQRQLLEQQWHREPRGSVLEPHAFQRPEVEKQQHERQRRHHRLRQQPGSEQQDDQRVVDPPAESYVAGVRADGRKPEASAQYVLAFGDPGDRFHVQRVDRKQRSHQRAPPHGAGHGVQHRQQEERAGDVEPEVHQMRTAGRRAEQLGVELMRHPRQRSAGSPVGIPPRP